MKLILDFLQLFSPSIFGFRMIEAAEAFETPPLSRAARRYAGIAFCSLLAAAASLVIAALVDTFAKARPLSEELGWTGIVALILSVYFGLRYREANELAAKTALAEQERHEEGGRDSGRMPN